MKEKPTYRELLEEFLQESSICLRQANVDYALEAIDRGNLIADVMEKYIPIRGSKVLDMGCGEGGVAIAFALRGAEVTALDISPSRIERMKVWAAEHDTSVHGVVADVLETGLPGGQYDIVVSNDVLEHVVEGQKLAHEVDRLLKPGGVMYLETQNRLSIFEFLSDSHLRLFGITLLPRRLAAFYAVKIRRRTKLYTVGNIPTLGYVRRIFSETSIDLTPIHFQDPRQKVSDPKLLRSGARRRVMVAAHLLGLSRILLWLVDSPLFQFIPGSIYFVGTKR